MKKLSKEEKQRRIKAILNEVKKAPVIEGYYVPSYTKIAEKLGIRDSAVSYILRKLEEEGLVEIKQSAIFGSLQRRGIKIKGRKCHWKCLIK